MTLNEIRKTLLAEHQDLRGLAADADAKARSVQGGDPGALAELRVVLRHLDEAIQLHNHNEEQLLRGVIRNLDAWGNEREALMDEHHRAEHATLVKSLLDCATLADGDQAAGRARDLIAGVLDHMVREEQEILHPDVLSDDVVNVSFVG